MDNRINAPTYKKRMGSIRKFEPSQRRKERRAKLFEIIDPRDVSWIRKIDAIIDYFQDLYETNHWGGLTKYERHQLFLKRGGICMWCKRPLTLSAFTVEHIKPRVEFGGSEEENLGIACASCNNGRDGSSFTAGGYLISALIKYNPTMRDIANLYRVLDRKVIPNSSLDHDHDEVYNNTVTNNNKK